MKLTAALTILTLGVAEAQHAGTRRGRRRAQDAAADVSTIADSDLIEADSHSNRGNSCEEKVSGIVTVHYTGGAIDYTGNVPTMTPPTIYPGFPKTGIPTQPYPTGGVSYGGIAFEYNSETESIYFKSNHGTTFDDKSCKKYKKICSGPSRKLDETGDVVSEDRRNDCQGKDTVLFCQMSEGQSASFELTDTMDYCGGPGRKLQSEEEAVTGDMAPPRLARAGFKFYITTPGNSCPITSPPTNNTTNPVRMQPIATSGCNGADVVAILQCGPTRNDPYPAQTSECLYGSDCSNNGIIVGQPGRGTGGRGPGSAGLGIDHAINLEHCFIRSSSNTKRGVTPSTVGGDGRRLAIVEASNIINAMGGDLNGAFFEKDNIISKDAVDALRQMSEHKYSVDDFDPNAPHHQQEFRTGSNLTPERLAFYELSGENLIDAIGKDNSKAILDFVHESFGADTSVSKISLQHANMDQQMFIAPHMDGKDTALVFLGGSDASVVYLNDKEGNTEAQTYPGKALAHGANTVHSEYMHC